MGGCQEGPDEVDIISHFVDILTVGNFGVYSGTCIAPSGSVEMVRHFEAESTLKYFSFPTITRIGTVRLK
jgi:hypothetical protein